MKKQVDASSYTISRGTTHTQPLPAAHGRRAYLMQMPFPLLVAPATLLVSPKRMTLRRNSPSGNYSAEVGGGVPTSSGLQSQIFGG